MDGQNTLIEEEDEEEEVSEEEIEEMLDVASEEVADELRRISDEIIELDKETRITDVFIEVKEEENKEFYIITAKSGDKIVKTWKVDLTHFNKVYDKYAYESEKLEELSNIEYYCFIEPLAEYAYNKVVENLEDFEDFIEKNINECEGYVRINFEYYKLPLRPFDIDIYISSEDGEWLYKRGWEEVVLGSFFIFDSYDHIHLQPILVLDDEAIETICEWGDKRSIERLKEFLEELEVVAEEDLSEYKKMCEEALKKFEEEDDDEDEEE